MQTDGFFNIIDIDFSPIIVKQMQEVYHKKYYQGENIEYLYMDISNLSFESGKFDVIIDKGTIDTCLQSDFPKADAKKIFKEVDRVLKDDGIFLSLSYAPP